MRSFDERQESWNHHIHARCQLHMVRQLGTYTSKHGIRWFQYVKPILQALVCPSRIRCTRTAGIRFMALSLIRALYNLPVWSGSLERDSTVYNFDEIYIIIIMQVTLCSTGDCESVTVYQCSESAKYYSYAPCSIPPLINGQLPETSHTHLITAVKWSYHSCKDESIK